MPSREWRYCADFAAMATETADAAVAFAIVSEADLIRVRQVLRAEAVRAGLGLVDQTKLVTAGSELARNILNYATGRRGRLQRPARDRRGPRHPARHRLVRRTP